MSGLQPGMVSLAEIVGLPRNPKAHDVGAIHGAYKRFGFLQRIIINTTTGRLIAGHGRRKTLHAAKVGGENAPVNIEVRPKDGAWMVPVDYVEIVEDQEEAAALALDRIGEGDYDEVLLTQVLTDLASAPSGLEGTGFDGDDLDALLAFTTMLDEQPLANLEWDDPEKAHRIIIQCETADEVLSVAVSLGIVHKSGQVRYNFLDTVLGREEGTDD